MRAAVFTLAAVLFGVSPAWAAPPQCADVVAAYNRAAGHNGVPDILSGWTVENATHFRFRDGGTGRPTAESGVTCNADGSLDEFKFVLAWTGNPPLAAMASAQIAAETVSRAVAPDGKRPDYQALADQALDNAQMLRLATQAERMPTGNGYEAYTSISRNAEGGGITYGVRQQR